MPKLDMLTPEEHHEILRGDSRVFCCSRGQVLLLPCRDSSSVLVLKCTFGNSTSYTKAELALLTLNDLSSDAHLSTSELSMFRIDWLGK